MQIRIVIAGFRCYCRALAECWPMSPLHLRCSPSSALLCALFSMSTVPMEHAAQDME